jgi:DNA mismatch repair protein MutS
MPGLRWLKSRFSQCPKIAPRITEKRYKPLMNKAISDFSAHTPMMQQ